MAFEQCIEHLEATLHLAPENREARSDLLYFMAMKGNQARFRELEEGGGFEQLHLARCHNRMGQTLVYQGERRQAMKWFDSAIGLDPASFRLQWSKHLTVSTSYRSEEDLANSRQRYLHGLERIADIYDNLPDDRKKTAHRCAEQLTNFEIHYQSENDIEVQKPYGALFHRIMSHSFPDYMKPLPRRHPGNARRIRVGFASWGCFFTHSNYKTHRAWITGLNRERFEVFGYALATTHDQTTTMMSREVEHYVPFGGNVDALRKRILADELDILVYPGIGMEPVLHRLAPFRLAPVQCTSWGHPVTTGLPNIDYYLSSDLMEPEDGQANYTETLVRLPNLGISQIPPGLPPEDQYRPPPMLAERERPGKVFLCSQNLLKMMPRHDYLFARILQAVPECGDLVHRVQAQGRDRRLQGADGPDLPVLRRGFRCALPVVAATRQGGILLGEPGSRHHVGYQLLVRLQHDLRDPGARHTGDHPAGQYHAWPPYLGDPPPARVDGAGGGDRAGIRGPGHAARHRP